MRRAFLSLLVGGLLLPSSQAQAQMVVIDPTAIAKDLASWVTNQLQLAGIGEGNAVGQAIQSAMATMRADNAIAAADMETRKKMAVDQSLPRIMGTNQTFCPAIVAPRAAMDVSNARRSLGQAMVSVMQRFATNDINSQVAAVAMYCKAGVLPREQGETLFDNYNCTTPPNGDTGTALNPKSVTGATHYPWPSTLTVGQNGAITFSGNPKPEDAPALAAIAHCLLKAPITDAPITGKRQGTSQDAVNKFHDMYQIAATTPAVSTCIDAVVNRLQIGPNAPGNLGTIYTAYAQQCQLMFHDHKMNQADEQNCLNNGVSFYDLQETNTCGRADDYLTNRIADNQLTNSEVQRDLNEGNKNCDSLHDKWEAESRAIWQASVPSVPSSGNFPAGTNR